MKATRPTDKDAFVVQARSEQPAFPSMHLPLNMREYSVHVDEQPRWHGCFACQGQFGAQAASEDFLRSDVMLSRSNSRR